MPRVFSFFVTHSGFSGVASLGYPVDVAPGAFDPGWGWLMADVSSRADCSSPKSILDSPDVMVGPLPLI